MIKSKEEAKAEEQAYADELQALPAIEATGFKLSVPEDWTWGEKVISPTRSVLQLATQYGSRAYFDIDVSDKNDIKVRVLNSMLFGLTADNEHWSAIMKVAINYAFQLTMRCHADTPTDE